MARDRFHELVRLALEKDGWSISDDPLHLRWGKIDLYIDLAAEQPIAAERHGEKIAVEIKSFLRQSSVNEFHTAIGQYTSYRVALAREDPQRVLYLAIPAVVFDDFFTTPFAEAVVQASQVNLLVYSLDVPEIVQWQTW
jgi:hypothetical protein